MDKQPRVDLDELRAALTGRMEALAENLLGDRNADMSGRSQWRFGARGSLSLEVSGRKRGTWHSHEAGQGGGPIDLIAFVRGIEFPAAVEWGADFAGIKPTGDDDEDRRRRDAEHTAERERSRLASEAEDAADEARRIASAQRIWTQTVPIAGTVGERYLVETRGIPVPEIHGDMNVWPDAVRFLPARAVTLPGGGPTLPAAGAVVLAATAPDGSVRAVQRVYLTADADNLRRDDGSKVKLTNGAPGGVAARLPGPTDGPLLIAEGPETGLSVWRATGHETWVALGAIGTVEPPIGRRVVVCRDDDKPHSPADKALSRALSRWGKMQICTLIATPWPARRGDRSDFNDVIRAGAVDAVRARIQAVLEPHGRAPARVTIEEGRKRLGKAVAAFFEAAAGWDAAREAMPSPACPDRDEPPAPDFWDWSEDDAPSLPPEPPPDTVSPAAPVHLVQIDTGGGKSAIARRLAAKALAAMRGAGDSRTMAIAVPTHALGAEQQLAFEALPEVREAGLRCKIWRGRRADDPDAPGERMCRNIELVREVQALKLDVEKRACGICPHKAECGYLGQRKLRADLWFVAHQMLFEMKPKALGDLAAVIVDENPIGCALEGAEQGVNHRPLSLSFDVLGRVDKIDGNGGGIATDRLMALRQAVVDVLGGHAAGPVLRAIFDFDGNMVTAAMARELRGLEWRTLVDVELTSNMTKDERGIAMQTAARNADLGRRVMLCNALEALLDDGPAASGWVAMGGAISADPASRHAELKGRRDIGKAWRVPTLVLDATARPELLRYLWPDLKVTADVRLQTPHQRIRQTTDAGFSLTRLDVDGAKDDAKRRFRQKNLRDLHAIVCREARQYAPGTVLVVAQMRVEKALLGLGHLPVNVRLEHHNNVRGRDEYRDARALIVVGRTMPPSSTIARMLESLTGVAAPTQEYERTETVRELADGPMAACHAWRYPDPVGEALRWSCCEAELVQIIGRGRAVNRTEATPLDVLLLTDVSIPLPVQPIAAADLDPVPADLMAAAGGIVFENPGHASDAYPSLWATRDTAKTAFRREKLGSTLYKKYSYTEMNPTSVFGRVDYRRSGQGQSQAVAWYDRSLIPDPEGALAGLLGPLA